MEEAAESAANKPPSPAHHHFVLVHGVGHGGWCWYKLRVLLEDAGHKVSCLDLAASGIDRSDPNSILTFDDYNKPLLDFMPQLPENEKIILVGHSAGGQSVTYSIHKFATKIKLAIYVAATMLPKGLCSKQDIESVPDFSRYGDVLELEYGLGPDQPPTSAAMRREFQRRIFYHKSPKEDSTLASMLLRPWPAMALSSARFERIDSGEVDQVRRVFVKTAYDRTVLPEQQDAMIKRWPPSKVVVVESDHSPFFSAPRQLFRVLLEAASASSP